MKKIVTTIAAALLLAANTFAQDNQGYAGIKTLALDENQLKKLGITVMNDRIEAYASSSVKLLIKAGKIDVITSRTPSSLPCFPRFVVNKFAKGSSSYYNKPGDYTYGTDETNSVIINGLVCVRIDAVLKDRGRHSENTVYLWFECTEELVKLLPTYKKVEVMAEIFDSTGINAQEPAYTEMYKMFSGALTSALIKPNPVYYDAGTLNFRLDEARTVSVKLYDVSGNHRRDFVAETWYGAGDHSVSLDMMDYPDGMYIVVITTNKNERVIQRVIKAR